MFWWGEAKVAGSPQACAVGCQAGVAFMPPRGIRCDRLAARAARHFRTVASVGGEIN